jgi:hypothetical protein
LLNFIIRVSVQQQQLLQVTTTTNDNQNRFAGRRFLTEVSRNNHFMYFNEGGHGKIPAGWTAPVENKQMGFNEWLAFALSHDNFTAETVRLVF